MKYNLATEFISVQNYKEILKKAKLLPGLVDELRKRGMLTLVKEI